MSFRTLRGCACAANGYIRLTSSRQIRLTTAVSTFALLLGAIVFRAWSHAEPSYQGRPLSAWLREYDKFEDAAYVHAAPPKPWPYDAVRHIGTNAIPWLLKSLRQRDSRLKIEVMRLVKLQSVLKLHFTPARVRRDRAAQAFGTLGLTAKPAIPALIELLGEPDARPGAVSSLVCIGRPCVPPMVQALTNHNPAIKTSLVWALYCLYPFASGEPAGIARDEANAAAPELREIMARAVAAGTNWTFVAAAALVINWIAPERVGEDVVPILVHALSDPRPDARERAAFALYHIHKEPRLTIPALTMALDDPTGRVRTWAILGLHRFKTDAAGAVPKLRLLLRAATGEDLREAALALIDIDPTAAKESGAYEILGRSPPP